MLQKRAALVILYADRQASSAALFNKLHWIPFYEQCNIDRCSILYKRIHGSLPSYLDDHLVINHKRTFAVSASSLWNDVPLSTRNMDSVACFKHNMWSKIFRDQPFFRSHFSNSRCT